jgi:ectoine hydroxylase-related dioxygenase (phytanoyl-CoA dioxygenase family)
MIMLTEADITTHAQRIRDDGYTVIERAADPALVAALISAVERIERDHQLGCAKTSFEGFKTLRVNNLLTYDEVFWDVPLHSSVLPIVEAVLDKECLLSSFCSLVLGPGQEAQPIHEDTQLIPLPRPHIPITLNAILSFDFASQNRMGGSVGDLFALVRAHAERAIHRDRVLSAGGAETHRLSWKNPLS